MTAEGVIFLEPKGISNEMLEDSASVNSVQGSGILSHAFSYKMFNFSFALSSSRMANLVDTQIPFNQVRNYDLDSCFDLLSEAGSDGMHA